MAPLVDTWAPWYNVGYLVSQGAHCPPCGVVVFNFLGWAHDFTTGPNLSKFSSRFGIWRAYIMLKRTNFLEKNGKKSSGNWILISSSAYSVNGIATSLVIYLQADKIRSIRST